MPKPKKNESKTDYLKRCTAELIDKEGKESDQAFAICNSYWDEAKGKKRSSLTLEEPLEIQLAKVKDGEVQKAKFAIVAYTGKPISRWWGPPIVIDVEGMRLAEKMPVLREHMRDRIVGTTTQSKKEKGQLYVYGDIHEITKDGEEIIALAQDGFPWQASIGVWAEKILSIKEGAAHKVNDMTIKGPADIWTQSRVGEVSFCALGADDDTAAIVMNQDGGQETEITNEGGEEMEITLELLKEKASDLLKQIQNEARAEGAKTERQRVVEILGADGDRAVTLQAITNGTQASETFKLFFEAEKKRRSDTLEEMRRSAPASVGGGGEQDPTPPANGAQFKGEVDKLVTQGMPRGAAVRKLMKERPDLHEAWLKEMRPAERQ